ncbi:MAG TPA: hypothetical protein VFR87_09145 [Nocardioidaceae bacterium]|nr:hypothetical protein [Nocardioidaceae bacterium]
MKKLAPCTLRGTRVDGNLQCKSNDPAPVGDNNQVQGDKEDQCRGL